MPSCACGSGQTEQESPPTFRKQPRGSLSYWLKKIGGLSRATTHRRSRINNSEICLVIREMVEDFLAQFDQISPAVSRVIVRQSSLISISMLHAVVRKMLEELCVRFDPIYMYTRYGTSVSATLYTHVGHRNASILLPPPPPSPHRRCLQAGNPSGIPLAQLVASSLSGGSALNYIF